MIQGGEQPARVHLRSRALPLVVASFAALLVYYNSLPVPLLLDDVTTIANNPSIRQLFPLGPVLFPPPEIYSAGRPLLNLSFALNYAFGQTAVGGYHVVNVLIHVAAGLALFGLIRRTLLLPRMARFHASAGAIATVAALLWLVHPAQTASVTYISQRAESLMGMFYLLTLYGFVRGAKEGRQAGFTLSVAACACAMASKEVAVTAPVLVLLFDRQFVSGTFREAWSRHRRYYLALASTWLLLIALMVTSQLEARGIGLGHSLPRLDYMRIECVAVLKYLQLSLWPHPLVFDYGPQIPVPRGLPLGLAVIALLALLIATAAALRRALPIGFAAAAFFILLAPTSSFVPVAGQPIAENRIYLPSAALIATVVAGGARLLGRRARFAACAAIVAAGGLAHDRNRVFQSELRVWHDSAYKRLTNARAWAYLSFAYTQSGQIDAAIATLQRAIALLPNNAELHNNLGIFLVQRGKRAEGIAALRAAVRLNPAYLSAHHSLARILFDAGDHAGAAAAYGDLLRYEPNNADAHNRLGVALYTLGRVAEATEHFRTALALKPDFADARANLEAMRAAKSRQ